MGFGDSAPLLITQHPAGTGPEQHQSYILKQLTPPPQHAPKDQKSPVSSTYTPPPHQSSYPCPLPHLTAQRGEPVCTGNGSPAPTPGRPSPAKPRLGPAHPSGAPESPYLEAGEVTTQSPCCVFANRRAGEGPSAGHSSASAAPTQSRGPNVRRARTGGWLFWWGGDDVSSASLGRMGCLRAGAGQILYFGGEKVSGNEVSCCIKDSGGAEIVRETE